MKNFNTYDPVLFKNWFVTTELYSQIQNDFDLITWDVDKPTFSIPGMTPRQFRFITLIK